MEKDSLVKRIGTTVGAAGLGLALAMGTPQDAQAEPGAVRAEMKTIDGALSSAWDHCVLNIKDVGYGQDGYTMCRRILGIHNGGTRHIIDKQNTPLESFAYHLILARSDLAYDIRQEQDRIKQSGNLPLFYFTEGLIDMYRYGNNHFAREHFATGVFTAAGYRESQALSKAEEFSEASLVDKERMLNEIDLNSLEKEEKRRLYWNLGFYILSDYQIIGKNILPLRNTEGNFYDILFNKFKFHTASNKLS